MSVEIRALNSTDVSVLENVASDVFDDPLDSAMTRAFLKDPRHHLVVAIETGWVVGFVSAVHYLHPDKPHPELWINEVGVAPSHQQRGLGRQLICSTLDLARTIGCAEAWVLTDRANNAAMKLYASSGGVKDPKDSVMFEFRLDEVSNSSC